jgi:protocatechuate 3,4-dioxygenase beta subunit
MRPLLVVLILAGALVGIFFALNLTETDSGDGIDPTGGDTSFVEPDKTPLVGQDIPVDTVREKVLPVAGTPRPEDVSNRLFGSIVNGKNTGVAKARVVLTRFGSTNLVFQDQVDRSSDLETETDELGKYMFEDIPAFEQYSLVITHPDYAQTEASQISVGPEGDFPHYAIVMEDGSRVYGYVKDTGGASVSGATISLASTDLGLGAGDAADTITATTDDQGLYEFKHAAARNYVMDVRADGFGRVTLRQFHVSGRGPLLRNVELTPAVMIGGRVVAAGETPMEGATVQAYSTTSSRGKQSRSEVVTMKDGEFFFEDLPNGTYTLLVKAEGFKPERVQRVEAGDMNVIVELRALPMIKGRVVDAATGKPVRNYVVRLRQEVAIQGMGKSAPVSADKLRVTNSRGEYAIACPKGGTYLVEAWSDVYPGCMSTPVTVADEQTIEGIEVKMSLGGKIRGRLVDNQGKPIAKGRVTTHDNDWSDDAFMISMADMWPTVATTRSVVTNSQGEFVIAALTPTLYQIEVKHGEYSGTYKKSISVAESGEANVGDIKLNSGGTVRGTVYDSSATPLAGAVVQLTSSGMAGTFPVTLSAKTNGEGKYVLRHVKGGTYDIRAMNSAGGSASNPFQQMADMKRTAVTIAVFEGQEVVHDFNLAAPEVDEAAAKASRAKGGRGPTKPGGRGTTPRGGATEKGGSSGGNKGGGR